MPSRAKDPVLISQFAKLERLSASPGAFKALLQQNALIDVRPILANVRVPTLVLHCSRDALAPVENGRYLASQIPGAKYLEYTDGAHGFLEGDVPKLCGEIEEFVTGKRESELPDLERVLATVLFTDIVDLTNRAVQMGDHSWRSLLDEHDRIARRIIEKYRGHLVKTTGDGILATFDGPGRAIRCALDFEMAAAQIGLPSRAGLHAGEVEIRDKDIGGIAVHAAARVMALSTGRSSCLEGGNGPGRRSRTEVRSPGSAQAQGVARPLGLIRGEPAPLSRTCRPPMQATVTSNEHQDIGRLDQGRREEQHAARSDGDSSRDFAEHSARACPTSPLGVIHDRVEPAASPVMSAMPEKRKKTHGASIGIWLRANQYTPWPGMKASNAAQSCAR